MPSVARPLRGGALRTHDKAWYLLLVLLPLLDLIYYIGISIYQRVFTLDTFSEADYGQVLSQVHGGNNPTKENNKCKIITIQGDWHKLWGMRTGEGM